MLRMTWEVEVVNANFEMFKHKMRNLLQKISFSLPHLHHHLSSKAKFLFLIDVKPKPPTFLGLQILSNDEMKLCDILTVFTWEIPEKFSTNCVYISSSVFGIKNKLNQNMEITRATCNKIVLLATEIDLLFHRLIFFSSLILGNPRKT